MCPYYKAIEGKQIAIYTTHRVLLKKKNKIEFSKSHKTLLVALVAYISVYVFVVIKFQFTFILFACAIPILLIPIKVSL